LQVARKNEEEEEEEKEEEVCVCSSGKKRNEFQFNSCSLAHVRGLISLFSSSCEIQLPIFNVLSE